MNFKDKIYYHIYPLGLCNAPHKNDQVTVSRIKEIQSWIPHIQSLGITDVYLGPVFESESHGYDTIDYQQVDHRLGTNADLKELVSAFHKANIRVTLDAVFNHTGRSFIAFQDILQNRENSSYKEWYSNLNFGEGGVYEDGIFYDGWAGHYSLVKLNLSNPKVKNYLLDTVSMWIREFDIDGLRVDAADVMDKYFLSELKKHSQTIKKDFFIFGEVVHGNYTEWANPNCLHSVTNYEAYKSFWSSHKDKNLFEIAWTLNRQFGNNGIYKEIPLYNFVDNHDVARLRSNLMEKAHLYTVYGLLFTVPGIPSVYYGSEFGLKGKKEQDDWILRPSLNIREMKNVNKDLQQTISDLINIRKNSHALKYGNYEEISVSSEQLIFRRKSPLQEIIVAINISSKEIISQIPQGNYFDILNKENINDPNIKLYPNWIRILEKIH